MAYSILVGQYKRANDSLSRSLRLFSTGRGDYDRKRQYLIADLENRMCGLVYAPIEHATQQHEIEYNQLTQHMERQSEINADQMKYVHETRNERLKQQIRNLTKKIQQRDLKINALLHLKFGDRIEILVNNEMRETGLRNQLRKTLNEKHDMEAKMIKNTSFLNRKVAQLEKELESLRTKHLEVSSESMKTEIDGSNELPVHKERQLPEQKQQNFHETDATLGGHITALKTKTKNVEANVEHRDLEVSYLGKILDNTKTEKLDMNGQVSNKALVEKGDQLTELRSQFKQNFRQFARKGDESEDIIISLQENIQHLEEEVSCRDRKIKQLEEMLESNRTISELVRQEMKEKDDKLHKLRDEIKLTLKQKHEKEIELGGDISSLTKTIRHLEKEVQERDLKVKDLEVTLKNRDVSQRHINEQSNNSLLKEKDAQLSDLRNQLQHMSKQFKDKEDAINENITSLKITIQHLEAEVSNRDLEVKRLIGILDRKNIESTNVKQPNKDVMEKKVTELKSQLQQTLTTLKDTENELDETKTRLSKAMGDRLTYNNPNIADLSDRNRPTKLAERYAELYDNQWTDAFDILFTHFQGDENTVEALIKILQDAMRFCKTKGQKQMGDLQRVLEFSDKRDHRDISADMYKFLKDSRKAMASVAIGNLFQMYASHLKGSTDKTLKTALKVSSFTKECLEICWLMVIQDPSVVFAQFLRRGTRFNTDLFKPYTSSGTHVDYVVWPALLLHEGGPVLAKGVAQGYNKKEKQKP